MMIVDEKTTAIEKIHHEFAKMMQNERCRTCSCLHTDMMASILDTIREVSSTSQGRESLTAAERDFSKWIEGAGKTDLHQ